MIGKQAASHEAKQCGRKHQFLVHLLKVTRLPTQIPSSNVDGKSPQHPRRDALKVTALYNSHQIALGDFPIWMNECIIDRQLTCRCSVSKSDTQSKLHLYVDQTCSSGLTGHLALDLIEYIREDESETFVKYPLYANVSRSCKGPALKVVIKSLGTTIVEPFIDEENDILLLPPISNENFHDNGVPGTPDVGHTMNDGNFDPANLSQLEGALSEIGEKLKTLVATFKSKDHLQFGDSTGAEFDYQSSTTSPLLSSRHTGTSLDSRSEIYEEQCTTDSDDVFDSSFDLGHSAYPLTMPKLSRATSEIASQTAQLRHLKALRQGRRMSHAEASSESWLSQLDSSGKSHLPEHHCPEECFLCSSEHMLQSYEGIQASLSRSKHTSLRTQSLQLTSFEAQKARKAIPISDNELCAKVVKDETPVVTGKGPSLLKGLFGAVVVAGVSILGVRNSQVARDRTLSIKAQTGLARNTSISLSSDVMSEKVSRHRYSFRR